MNILLTNDDGYDSIGLRILKEKLSKYGKVIVVAPLRQMSAKSMSLSLEHGLTVERKEEDIYAVDGTPVDCVCFGLVALSIKFDLVVSGCNNGFNLSYDTLYSGTVGAALESLIHRIPSVAFSCHFNFDLVEQNFDEVFRYILDNDLLSKEYILNVNFPIGDVIEGIKLTTLYYFNHESFFVKENDRYYIHRHTQKNFDDEPESDCYSVYHKFVSITPLNKTYFSNDHLEDLKKKIK